MSDSDNSQFSGFGKFVPGFDFLQNLATQAAGSTAESSPQLPNLGSWVAPTLNVEELDKRIQELKSVQFWLDQNAMALKATIQALEVQKMTLATLKGMNFNMGDVANAFRLKLADEVAVDVQGTPGKAKTFAGLEVPPTNFGTRAAPAKKAAEPEPPAAGLVDPMQWWGALTQQFQSIAADAMKDAAKINAIDTTKKMVAGMAKEVMKTASGRARNGAKGSIGNATKTVAGAGRAALNTGLRSTQAWPTPVAAKKTAAKKPAVKATAKPTRKTSR